MTRKLCTRRCKIGGHYPQIQNLLHQKCSPIFGRFLYHNNLPKFVDSLYEMWSISPARDVKYLPNGKCEVLRRCRKVKWNPPCMQGGFRCKKRHPNGWRFLHEPVRTFMTRHNSGQLRDGTHTPGRNLTLWAKGRFVKQMRTINQRTSPDWRDWRIT